MQHIHHVLTRYGFLSSDAYPPKFSVPHYQRSDEKVYVDYWHSIGYAVRIHSYKNEGESEQECYLLLRHNGDFITELYSDSDFDTFFRDLFSNDVEPINPPNQNIRLEQAPQYNTIQPLPPRQQPYNQIQKYNQPQPLIDINQFLNEQPLTNYLYLENIIPFNHVIHKMASYLNREFPLPMSTLILVALGVASGMTARKWNCAYQKWGTKPICLYVVAEQKSGKGKTAALSIFQEPLGNAINERIKKLKSIVKTQEEILDSHLAREADDLSKEYKASFKLKTKQLTKDLNLSKDKLKNTYALLPKTQVTPEALEESLNNTNGFFLAASDEQTLIDSLISSKGKSKSNGILLAGRNGEEYNSEFRTRQGYQGIVTGSLYASLNMVALIK